MTETDAEQSVADIEQTVADAEAKGYYGETPDYDRDAYTLTTGPDSPSSLEATLTAKRAEIEEQLSGLKERAEAKVTSAKAAHESRSSARQSRRAGASSAGEES